MDIKSRNGWFFVILDVLLVRATSCMWLPKTSGLICISHRPLLQETFAKGQFGGKEGSCHLVCNNSPLFPRKINSKTCGDARAEELHLAGREPYHTGCHQFYLFSLSPPLLRTTFLLPRPLPRKEENLPNIFSPTNNLLLKKIFCSISNGHSTQAQP